jgi:putative adenylate-forming enzyme
MLKIIAKEAQSGRLSVHPQKLISYAEILYPDIKDYLEKIFHCPVHQIYKCTEGPIGISCKSGNLHINEDLVAVQLLDDDGLPTPDGQPCRKLIITDLHKKSQPIIRYELNDIITISKNKCPCGSNFRTIENIQGRANDLFWGIRKDTRARHFIYQDYISRSIITVSGDIDDYQAVQKDFTRVVLRIQVKKEADKGIISEKLKNGIRDVFSEYNCLEPEVEVLFAAPLPNKNSAKLARIICELKI